MLYLTRIIKSKINHHYIILYRVQLTVKFSPDSANEVTWETPEENGDFLSTMQEEDEEDDDDEDDVTRKLVSDGRKNIYQSIN